MKVTKQTIVTMLSPEARSLARTLESDKEYPKPIVRVEINNCYWEKAR